MRKVVYGINLSLDGCCDHTKFGGGDDVHNYFRELLEQTDLVIYGRKTYELMVPFWPEVAQNQSMNETSNSYAKVFASLGRVVVSRTLNEINDHQITIIRENLEAEILKLKQRPGKAISTGGVDLPGQLLALGLIDEFHIVVHPVLVGKGRRLFTEIKLPENANLSLTKTRTFDSGCVALQYDKIIL